MERKRKSVGCGIDQGAKKGMRGDAGQKKPLQHVKGGLKRDDRGVEGSAGGFQGRVHMCALCVGWTGMSRRVISG